MSWGVVYYRTQDGRVPAEQFLEGLPAKVAARFDVVLDTPRRAPPPQFSGGGFWKAMHGHERLLRDPHHRSWQDAASAVLDPRNADSKGLEQRGFDSPQIAVINGFTKKSGEKFSDAEYKRAVRNLSDELPEAGGRVDRGAREAPRGPLWPVLPPVGEIPRS